MEWIKKITLLGLCILILTSVASATIDYNSDDYISWECGNRKNTSLMCNITYTIPTTINTTETFEGVAVWTDGDDDGSLDLGYYTNLKWASNTQGFDINNVSCYSEYCLNSSQLNSQAQQYWHHNTSKYHKLQAFINGSCRIYLSDSGGDRYEDINYNNWSSYTYTVMDVSDPIHWSFSKRSGTPYTHCSVDEVNLTAMEYYNITKTKLFYYSDDNGATWTEYCSGCDKFNSTDAVGGRLIKAGLLLSDSFESVYVDNTTTLQFENITPTMTWITPNKYNNSVFQTGETIGIRIAFDDNNLFAYNVTVYDFLINERTQTTLSNINVTHINYLQIITLNTSGQWQIIATVEDDHTAKEIPEFEIKSMGDYIQFDTLRITALNSTGSTFNREKSRYTFGFDYKKDIDLKTYIIESDGKLYYRKNSGYVAHFVDYKNKKWVDFEGVDGNYDVEKVSDNKYIVRIESPLNEMDFKSVGYLNVVTETVLFTVQDEQIGVTFENFDLSNTSNVLLFGIFVLIWLGCVGIGVGLRIKFVSMLGWIIGFFLGLVFFQINVFVAFVFMLINLISLGMTLL